MLTPFIKIISCSFFLILIACDRTEESTDSDPESIVQIIQEPVGIETTSAADLHKKIAITVRHLATIH